MVLSKVLLLKCLGGGVAAICGATTIGLGIKNKWWQESSSKDSEASETNRNPPEGSTEPTDADLIAKVGLDCGTPSSNGTDCSIKTGTDSKITVKQGTTTFDVSTIPSGSGKIKLYKLNGDNTDYSKGLKFVIEEGDITSNNHTLEQFETYEIEEDSSTEGQDKKYYLKRKHTAIQEKEIILGLPEGCKLPENNATCTTVSLDGDALKKLNFEGKSDSSQASIDSGATVTLSITKETEDTDVFTDGYKFSFTTSGTGNVTIPGTSETITIPANKSVEFRIKKTGSKLSLEKAWTLDTLTAKVGLSCTSNTNECTRGTSETTTTNIKQGNDTQTLTTSWTGGKIKVYTTEATDYNKGFRFVIEEGDITFNTDKKLEENDTYEIKKENNEWYFLRKTESESKKLSKALGLPDGCKLPKTEDSPITCEGIDVEKLKKLNFEGKNSTGTPTITSDGTKLNLKITKTSDTATFPKGYRFAFEGDKEISIPLSDGGSMTLKKNTNTEFKIKEGGSGNFSLEKALDIQSLSKKINLKNCSTSTGGKKQCEFGERINLFNSESSSITEAKIVNNQDNKKITYEEDQEGYNQGIKLTLEQNISIQGDTKSKSVSSSSGIGMIDGISTSGGPTPSYEIKEQTVGDATNWYLTKYTAVS